MDMVDLKSRFDRFYKAIRARPELAVHRKKVIVSTSVGHTLEVDDGASRFEVASKPQGGPDHLPGPGALAGGALGMCLVGGYIEQFAVRGIDLRRIEVEIDMEDDVRGHFGISGAPLGLNRLSYSVRLDGDATEAQLAEIAEEVERLSPWFHTFAKPIAVTRGSVGPLRPAA